MIKKVLFFSKTPSTNSLSKAIKNQGWTLYHTASLADAIKLSEENQFNIAIAHTDTADNFAFFNQVAELSQYDCKTNWIVILPDKENDNSNESLRINKLIEKFCFDFHHHPVDLNRLLIIMGHAYGMAKLSRRTSELQDAYHSKFGMVGSSPKMIELFNKIDKVANENLSVLILGETGTGKELIARAIHANSSRADKPFIAVNCGTLPENLVQTELFGHEKGAFTGAHKSKIGRIEAAHRGTLFLDEVGDLPLPQQVNLLRFLEEKSILRVGGENHIAVDVRVIAATNIDLSQAIKDGEFREDLFYRLCELQLTTTPLRDRDGDIETLAQYFFNKFAQKTRKNVKGFSLGALYAINEYDWPGNVREMANSIQKAIIMSDKRLISKEDLDLDLDLNHYNRAQKRLNTLEEARADSDQASILESLRISNNNITRAAEILGISRVTLHRLMDKYQIKIQNTK